MQKVGVCCSCQGEIYASTEHVCTPTEAQMRLQMFNTMKAAEDAFKAIYEHLTPKDQEPAEQQNCFCGDPSLPGPHRDGQVCGCAHCDGGLAEADCTCTEEDDVVRSGKGMCSPVGGIDYGAIRAACTNCGGAVQFNNYRRDFDSEHDTCSCGDGGERVILPPDVQAMFDYRRGLALVKENETVSAPKPLDSDLSKIWDVLSAHRKALAIIGTFGQFKDAGFFCGTKPDQKVTSLVKLKGCSCVGTGWVARDETCKDCKQRGYIEA